MEPRGRQDQSQGETHENTRKTQVPERPREFEDRVRGGRKGVSGAQETHNVLMKMRPLETRYKIQDLRDFDTSIFTSTKTRQLLPRSLVAPEGPADFLGRFVPQLRSPDHPQQLLKISCFFVDDFFSILFFHLLPSDSIFFHHHPSSSIITDHLPSSSTMPPRLSNRFSSTKNTNKNILNTNRIGLNTNKHVINTNKNVIHMNKDCINTNQNHTYS